MKVMAPSLRNRILRLFLSLIIVASLTTIFAVLLATNQSVHQNTVERLELGQKVFAQLMDYRGGQLFDSAQLMTADFGFKSAVSAEDRETISSALANHGQRINADLMLLVSLGGELVASSPTELANQSSNELAALIQQAEAEGGLLTNALIFDGLYQVIIVSVNAPVPIAWAVIGFEINASLAQELKSLTNLDVTIIGGRSEQDMLYASTFDNAEALIRSQKLGEKMSKATELLSSDATPLPLDSVFESDANSNVVHLKSALSSDRSSPIYSILSESLTEEYERFSPLRIQLLLISSMTLLVSIFGAVVISSNITRPITDLVRATQKIREGDYNNQIETRRSSSQEITALASSIRTMQQDIAERENHIFYQLHHDMLTELPNRTKLIEDISKLISRQDGSQSFVLLEMNLNRFKQINDTFGLETGDSLLKAVADRLSVLMGGKGSVSHLGADEFAIVIPGGDNNTETEISLFVEEVMACLAQPFNIDEIEIGLSARFGAVIYPEHGSDAGQLLRRANIALTESKERKKCLSLYQNGADQEHVKKIMLINDLKRAIGNDELSMHYQPKIGIESKQVAQVEALIRWTHNTIGFVSPAEFIPLAEQAGLMPDLTRWVIRTVIEQVREWRLLGVNVVAAVNLSAHDLVSEALPEFVLDLLEANELGAKDLMLEVTESAVMEDPELSISVLDRFRELGFALSIDDYGTGYSSLSQLKKMPVQELKIDMSFIRQLDQDMDDQVIVRSTIDMAHNIGLTVVAEGVENNASWSLLEEWGCDKLQGYFISRPLPASDFVAWFQQFDAHKLRSA